MANTLRCTSSGYTYTFSGDSFTGNGKNEAEARTNALGNFPKDAESTAKKEAIDDAVKDYDCAGICELDVTVGSASFVQTDVKGALGNITVTVTIQVPVTLACSKRKIARISLAENAIQIAMTSLGELPVADISALAPFRDELSGLGVTNVRDLIGRAEIS